MEQYFFNDDYRSLYSLTLVDNLIIKNIRTDNIVVEELTGDFVQGFLDYTKELDRCIFYHISIADQLLEHSSTFSIGASIDDFEFVPKIPEIASSDEAPGIDRVCVATSFDNCVFSLEYPPFGHEIFLFRQYEIIPDLLGIDLDDIIFNEVVMDYVEDAYISYEYWILVPFIVPEEYISDWSFDQMKSTYIHKVIDGKYNYASWPLDLYQTHEGICDDVSFRVNDFIDSYIF